MVGDSVAWFLCRCQAGTTGRAAIPLFANPNTTTCHRRQDAWDDVKTVPEWSTENRGRVMGQSSKTLPRWYDDELAVVNLDTYLEVVFPYDATHKIKT